MAGSGARKANVWFDQPQWDVGSHVCRGITAQRSGSLHRRRVAWSPAHAGSRSRSHPPGADRGRAPRRSQHRHELAQGPLGGRAVLDLSAHLHRARRGSPAVGLAGVRSARVRSGDLAQRRIAGSARQRASSGAVRRDRQAARGRQSPRGEAQHGHALGRRQACRGILVACDRDADQASLATQAGLPVRLGLELSAHERGYPRRRAARMGRHCSARRCQRVCGGQPRPVQGDAARAGDGRGAGGRVSDCDRQSERPRGSCRVVGSARAATGRESLRGHRSHRPAAAVVARGARRAESVRRRSDPHERQGNAKRPSSHGYAAGRDGPVASSRDGPLLHPAD